jgi:hypothetical protein
MNELVYGEIIFDNLKPWADNLYPQSDFILHQDNSPIHTSDYCSRLLDELDVLWVLLGKNSSN